MLKQLILYSLVILICFGCGSSKDNKNKQSAVADTAENVDSAVQDNVDVRPPHPEPGLSPGTARITGRLLSVTAQPPNLKMTVKVTTVNEYGHSTPAIGTGAALTIFIPDFLAKDVKKLETDKKIVCLINYRQFLSSNNNNSRWVLTEVSSFEGPQ